MSQTKSSTNDQLTVVKQPIIRKFRLKRKKLYDEYVLTNKHIICKFKYLIVCFDRPDDPDLGGGLINLTKSRLDELLSDHMINWNITDPAYLDEVTVNIKQLPYAENRKYMSDEDDDICYVYPYMNLIPLHPIVD